MTTLSVTARIVVLDVVVTDQQGRVVNDLKKEDFKLLEDQVPQTIRSFEVPAQHVLPADVTIHSTEELRAKAPDMPINVIVLDELNTKFEDTAFARYSITQYIKAQPAKLSQPTELVAVSRQKFTVLHDYTQDGAALLAAMNKHLTDYPWHWNQGSTQESTVQRMGLSLAALEEAAEATKGHLGRKNLIWIGRGFPAVNPLTLSGDAKVGMKGAIEKMLDMLRDARVTLYTIDPTSLTTMYANVSNPIELSTNQEENGPDLFANDITFTTLAPASGGRAYFSRNDVDKSLGTSIRDGSNYYTLSYQPSNGMDGAAVYRRISVVVDRPGLVATTRNGYYPLPPAQDVTAKGQEFSNQVIFDMSSALGSNMTYTALVVKAAKGPGGGDSFVLHIDPATLGWKDDADGGRETTVIVETGSFGKKDKLLGRTAKEMTLRVGAQDRKTAGLPIDVVTTAKLVPGTERVRFVVRDNESGHVGTADFARP